MTKALTPAEMSKGQSDNTNNSKRKFDYTAIADRLRTVNRTIQWGYLFVPDYNSYAFIASGL